MRSLQKIIFINKIIKSPALKAEFDEKMKDQPYVSPVPKGEKPPLPED